jgi:hypothetical protein
VFGFSFPQLLAPQRNYRVFVEVRRRTCLKLFTQVPADFRNALNFKDSAVAAVRKGDKIRKRIMWRQIVKQVSGCRAAIGIRKCLLLLYQSWLSKCVLVVPGCHPPPIHGHVLRVFQRQTPAAGGQDCV